MQLDNPVFVPNASLPSAGVEGQLCFVTGLGFHQFLAGNWTLVTASGGNIVSAKSESMAQKQVAAADVLLYTATKKITITELTFVTQKVSSIITLYIKRGSTSYPLFKSTQLSAYSTTIISLSVPLEIGDVVYGTESATSSFNVTMTGLATTNQKSIVMRNVPAGTTTLYTATTASIITNLILVNSGVDTVTSLNIKRTGTSDVAALFLNELATSTGVVTMGDLNTAIDVGTSLQIVTTQPITLLITAV